MRGLLLPQRLPSVSRRQGHRGASSLATNPVRCRCQQALVADAQERRVLIGRMLAMRPGASTAGRPPTHRPFIAQLPCTIEWLGAHRRVGWQRRRASGISAGQEIRLCAGSSAASAADAHIYETAIRFNHPDSGGRRASGPGVVWRGHFCMVRQALSPGDKVEIIRLKDSGAYRTWQDLINAFPLNVQVTAARVSCSKKGALHDLSTL